MTHRRKLTARREGELDVIEITEEMRTCPDGRVLTLDEYIRYVVVPNSPARYCGILGVIGGPNLNLSPAQAESFKEGLRPAIEAVVRDLQEHQDLPTPSED